MTVNDIKQVKEMEEDLQKAISFDEWAGREYGITEIDYDMTAINLYRMGYRKVKSNE